MKAKLLLWLTALVLLADERIAAAIADPTVEEQRLTLACEEMPQLLCEAHIDEPSDEHSDAEKDKRLWQLDDVTNETLAAAVQQAQTKGTTLWRMGQRTADAKTPDDRWLYWQRLAELKRYRQFCDPKKCAAVIQAFERASRGINDVHFDGPDNKSALRIVVTGFDPFSLDANVDQSNPSGAAALAFDGLRIEHGGVRATLESMVFPVLITISMGRADFDLERFPGRRRSATAAGNLRIKTGASSDNPLVPRLLDASLEGPEFVEFNLPVAALQTVNSPFDVNDNRKVRTLERGGFAAASLSELSNQTAVSGSGGGYLSNEISYRTVHLAQQLQSTVPVGHIHTPRISGNDALVVHVITTQLRAMLEAALPEMEKLPTVRNHALKAAGENIQQPRAASRVYTKLLNQLSGHRSGSHNGNGVVGHRYIQKASKRSNSEFSSPRTADSPNQRFQQPADATVGTHKPNESSNHKSCNREVLHPAHALLNAVEHAHYRKCIGKQPYNRC